jgi:sialidase-1
VGTERPKISAKAILTGHWIRFIQPAYLTIERISHIEENYPVGDSKLAMLFKSIFCGLLMVALGEKVGSQNTMAPLVDLFYSDMTPGVACYRIPALTIAPNGTLLAAADERVPSCQDLGRNPDINIVLRRSQDGGMSWSKLEKLVDFPAGISASDASFIVDQVTGKIFLFFNKMDLINAPGLYRFQWVSSADNGRTWSEPVDITSHISQPVWENDFHFITSGNGIQTDDGTLLHTLVHVGQKAAYVFGSRDHGRSWFVSAQPAVPADESRIAELPDGSWLVNARVNDKGMRFLHVSKDQGKTWQSRPEPLLTDPGCNAAMLQSRSGRHPMLYFINPASPSSRSKLSIRTSDNNGQTWRQGEVLYKGSAAYASADWISNKEIGILFERDEYSRITFLRYRLP